LEKFDKLTPKYFKDLPTAVRIKFIKDTFIETYPFTEENIADYENSMDFVVLSANQMVTWNSDIIEKYKDKWDWVAIQNNSTIYEEVNLGYLFPDKVSIPKPKCACRKKNDFCNEKKPCIEIYDETRLPLPTPESINPLLYGYIKYLFEDCSYGNTLMNSILQYDFLTEAFGDYEIYSNTKIETSKDDYCPF